MPRAAIVSWTGHKALRYACYSRGLTKVFPSHGAARHRLDHLPFSGEGAASGFVMTERSSFLERPMLSIVLKSLRAQHCELGNGCDSAHA